MSIKGTNEVCSQRLRGFSIPMRYLLSRRPRDSREEVWSILTKTAYAPEVCFSYLADNIGTFRMNGRYYPPWHGICSIVTDRFPWSERRWEKTIIHFCCGCVSIVETWIWTFESLLLASLLSFHSEVDGDLPDVPSHQSRQCGATLLM